MGRLVSEHRLQPIVIGLLEQAGGDEELPVAGIGGVDVRVVHQPDLHLVRLQRMVHRLEQRGPHALETLGLRRIERLGAGTRCARIGAGRG